jgi:hypothetical protein
MKKQYFFTVIWGQISDASGEAVASFQCGSAEDLRKVGHDAEEEWICCEGESSESNGVEIWNRSNDELTYVLGRGSDYENVSAAFFRTIRENFAGHLKI